VLRRTTCITASLGLALAGCGGHKDRSSSPSAAGQATSRSAGSRTGCSRVAQPGPKPNGGERQPSTRLDPARIYDVTLETTCGDITTRLDPKASPHATASFVSLARKGFFDGTVFHRIVPGFVIQGGDPTQSGRGGPGYSTRDVPPRGTSYAKAVVAMAKAGSEPPGTAGSQFYIVTGDATQLPPDYALLGRVTRGLAAAERIDKLGDPRSGDQGAPLRPVVIERARVSVS
jgi:peptidyl-prolyl cis-trans isomerase B (cyclophilin B)